MNLYAYRVTCLNYICNSYPLPDNAGKEVIVVAEHIDQVVSLLPEWSREGDPLLELIAKIELLGRVSTPDDIQANQERKRKQMEEKAAKEKPVRPE